MLELVAVAEGKQTDNAFYKLVKENRKVFFKYFYIKDIDNKVLYIYTQTDIEYKLFFNNIDVKGLKRNGNKLTDFIEVPYVQNYDLREELYRVEYGSVITTSTPGVIFKEIFFYSEDSYIFVKDSFDMALCVSLKNKNTYEFERENINQLKFNRYLFNVPSTVSVDNMIAIVNEWRSVNKLNLYMFREYNLLERIDLTGLNSVDIYDYCFLFNCCKNIKYIKMCDLDLSIPQDLEGMFITNNKLTEVDFTNITRDYPEDLWNISSAALEQRLTVKPRNTKNKIIFKFNDNCPKFMKCFVESNNLEFLGYVKENTTLDSLLAKRVLMGKEIGFTDYYVIVKD